MKCHEMPFKLFTNFSQSSQRISALNVEGLDDFLLANLSSCMVQGVKSLEVGLLVLCQVLVMK